MRFVVQPITSSWLQPERDSQELASDRCAPIGARSRSRSNGHLFVGEATFTHRIPLVGMNHPNGLIAA